MPTEVGLSDGTKLHYEMEAEAARDRIWHRGEAGDGWIVLEGRRDVLQP